jgi:peptidoglycan/LPS O-acetylase OafA/YrhL
MRSLQLTIQSRSSDNHFNFLRALASLAVLASHSIALVGNGDRDRYFLLSKVLGSIAVDIFFVISGFLVTASLTRGQHLGRFLWARFLRIYPGLWVMILVSLVIVGPLYTTLPIVEYFSSSTTHHYLIITSSLVMGVSHELPGVFKSNPYPGDVNGSLWTLPYEIRLYLSHVFLWIFAGILPSFRSRLFCLFLSLLYLSLLWYVMLNLEFVTLRARLPLMFFAGATIYVLRAHLPEPTTWFGPLFILMLAGWLLSNGYGLKLAYTVLLPFWVVAIAYVPLDCLKRLNGGGDYSYGIYIYSFPVQQSLVASIPQISTLKMMGYSFVITSLLAAASWYWIERRALQFKTVFKG